MTEGGGLGWRILGNMSGGWFLGDGGKCGVGWREGSEKKRWVDGFVWGRMEYWEVGGILFIFLFL